MKANLIDKTGKEKGKIELPEAFSTPIREDILLKVFEAQKRHQPMGLKPFAGMMYSASGILRRKRHSWKVTYGKGIARTPRKIMSRHGVSFVWVGATVSNTRGGRRAHGPKSWENQFKKINKKEMKIALCSALNGTVNKEALAKKYSQEIKFELPVVFDSSVLNLKTKEFFGVLKSVFGESFEKLLQKKEIRAGRGKMRGRTYKQNAGLLFVVGNDEDMKISGIDVVKAGNLAIKDLAPNGFAGRFTCYTEKAIKDLTPRLK